MTATDAEMDAAFAAAERALPSWSGLRRLNRAGAFIPTHLICWTPAGGEEQTCEVMLRPDGSAPTEVEHRFGMDTHWSHGQFRGWLCDMDATPGRQKGKVEVLPLPPCDATIREAAEETVERFRAAGMVGADLRPPISATDLATQWEIACRLHAPLRDLPPDESRAGLAVFSAEVRRILAVA